MNVSNAPNRQEFGGLGPPARGRLIRDRSALERFGLRPAEMYRVAYVAGGGESRRVSRSLAVFNGESERRRWDGQTVTCLDFVLPQGRPLSLLATQLVDVRPAGLNERGQWVLMSGDGQPRRRSRSGRRSLPA
jgi:hypothetical protein